MDTYVQIGENHDELISKGTTPDGYSSILHLFQN